MQDTHDQDALPLDEIHEPIGTNEQLPKVGELGGSKPMPAIRELLEGLRGIDHKPSQGAGIGL